MRPGDEAWGWGLASLEIRAHLFSCVLSRGDTCSEDRNWIIRGSKFSISCSSVLSACGDLSLIGVEVSVRAGGEKGNLHQPLSLCAIIQQYGRKVIYPNMLGPKGCSHSVLGRGGGGGGGVR